MRRPPILTQGPRWLVDKFDALMRWVEQETELVPGYGIAINANRVITNTAPAVAVAAHPFLVENASDSQTEQVTVAPGTVNDVVPTIGGVALNADPAPLLTVSATNKLIVLIVEFDDTEAIPKTILTVQVQALDQKPDDEQHLYHIILAELTFSDPSTFSVAQFITHSLKYSGCNTSIADFQHVVWGV